MAQEEMTIAEILTDPLVRQMMKADGVTLLELRTLLFHTAARNAQRLAALTTTDKTTTSDKQKGLSRPDRIQSLEPPRLGNGPRLLDEFHDSHGRFATARPRRAFF